MKRGGGGGGEPGAPLFQRVIADSIAMVSEGKLIVTDFQLLAPLVLGGAPIFKPPPQPPRH